jgi:hypothetical protein
MTVSITAMVAFNPSAIHKTRRAGESSPVGWQPQSLIGLIRA